MIHFYRRYAGEPMRELLFRIDFSTRDPVMRYYYKVTEGIVNTEYYSLDWDRSGLDLRKEVIN